MKKNYRSSSGQSLVEVMVALSILVVGLLGILGLLSQSLYISKNLSDQVTATYLAEEGIELSKNIIDYDVYRQRAGNDASAPGWGLGGPEPTFAVGHDYEIDYASCETADPGCSLFPYSPNSYLLFDPNTDLYGYEVGSPTPFTREITVSSTGVNEITIQSIVTWSVGGGEQNVTLEDHFYNWHP